MNILNDSAKIHINYDNSMTLRNISAERNGYLTDFTLSLSSHTNQFKRK